MKNTILLLSFFLISLFLNSCVIADIKSNPKNYKIVYADTKDKSTKMFLHQGAGKYDEILPIGNVYTVNIPSMSGGYSKIFGIKFNKHIPEEYQVLKLMKDEKIIREFSIIEIESLNKDMNGYYIIKTD